MKRNLLHTIIILFSITLFFSCEDSPTFKNRSKRLGQKVAGEIGELIVICDDNIWNSTVKPYLDTNLTQFIMPYYPDVPTFMLVHKTPEHFDKGVKRYRSMLYIKIDPNLKGKKVQVEKRMDVWAIDQLVIDIISKDKESLLEFCKTGGLKSVHQEFDDMEWRRITNYFQESSNDAVNAKLEKKFGIKLGMPDGAILENHKDNFFRIDFPVASRPIEFSNAGSQDRGNVFSGIMVYDYDFIDSTQFTFEALLAKRDAMLTKYAPYQVEGMYMGTQYTDLVYPEIDPMNNYNTTVSGVEIRGMYVFVGRPVYAPGGAFWEYHFVHPKRKKIICISGFLDAPSTHSWTHQLRELQAVLKSVEFVN